MDHGQVRLDELHTRANLDFPAHFIDGGAAGARDQSGEPPRDGAVGDGGGPHGDGGAATGADPSTWLAKADGPGANWVGSHRPVRRFRPNPSRP